MNLKAKIEIRKLEREKKQLKAEMISWRSQVKALKLSLNSKFKSITRLTAKTDVLKDKFNDVKLLLSFVRHENRVLRAEIKVLNAKLAEQEVFSDC